MRPRRAAIDADMFSTIIEKHSLMNFLHGSDVFTLLR
jgi:hypothetical protein